MNPIPRHSAALSLTAALFIAASAHGQNYTVDQRTSLAVSPVAGHIATAEIWSRVAATYGAYGWDQAIDTQLDNTATVTIPQFRALLTHGYGLWYLDRTGQH